MQNIFFGILEEACGYYGLATSSFSKCNEKVCFCDLFLKTKAKRLANSDLDEALLCFILACMTLFMNVGHL
jgi:hypothetical protein